MNGDHSDSDSDEKAQNMQHHNYFKDHDSIENPLRRVNKNRMSPPKIIPSLRYKSLRFAQQME
jgi:hypothetical protein